MTSCKHSSGSEVSTPFHWHLQTCNIPHDSGARGFLECITCGLTVRELQCRWVPFCYTIYDAARESHVARSTSSENEIILCFHMRLYLTEKQPYSQCTDFLQHLLVCPQIGVGKSVALLVDQWILAGSAQLNLTFFYRSFSPCIYPHLKFNRAIFRIHRSIFTVSFPRQPETTHGTIV